MALSIKKTSARQLGQNSDRDVFAVYSGSKLYKHKTKSGMVFKFATTLPKAKEILQKLKSDGSSSETKRSGASQPKARAPSSSSAKMTVSSCSQFLRDAGYSVSKKKGKKTEDEEMSDQDIYLRDLMNPRKRTRKKQRKAADTLYGGKKGASKFHLKRELAALKRAQKSLRLDYNNDLISLDDYRIMDRNLESQMEMIERELGMYDSPRKNPNRSAYVVTFRIGGGRDEYQDTIMASSQTEAIRLAHDMMDEMGDGVLVSVVPQAVADTDIIFDFNNPRRRRTRRKNPRKGMSYADVLRLLKKSAMVVRQTLPGKFRLKVEGSASPRASLTGRDYASIFGLDPASSFSVTMTPPGEESQTYHSNMIGKLSPEAMSEMHPVERAQIARRYLMNSLPDEYRRRKRRRKNPRTMRRLR